MLQGKKEGNKKGCAAKADWHNKQEKAGKKRKNRSYSFFSLEKRVHNNVLRLYPLSEAKKQTIMQEPWHTD